VRPPAVVGVDPGANETGVVARRGGELLAAEIVSRGRAPDGQYLALVLACVGAMVQLCDAAVVAVEGLVHPRAYRGGDLQMVNVSGLLGTAAVYGAVLARWPSAVVVAPAGHGSSPLAAYPQALLGRNERRGTGRRRHARSAWDIAGAAARLGVVSRVPA